MQKASYAEKQENGGQNCFPLGLASESNPGKTRKRATEATKGYDIFTFEKKQNSSPKLYEGGGQIKAERMGGHSDGLRQEQERG